VRTDAVPSPRSWRSGMESLVIDGGMITRADRLARSALTARSSRRLRNEIEQLLPIVAIDRSGMIVHDDGVVARIVAVGGPNPRLLRGGEMARLSHSLGALVADACHAGASLQVHLQAFAPPPAGSPTIEAHLVRSAPLVARVARLLKSDAELTRVRSRVAAAFAEASARSWEETAATSARLQALGLECHQLDGVQVAELIGRRLGPSASAPPSRRRIEVRGTLDQASDVRSARRAAGELRACAWGVVTVEPTHVRVGDELEQVVFVAGVPDAQMEQWLDAAMVADVPFVLSVHLRPGDRRAARGRGPDSGEAARAATVSGYIALRVPADDTGPSRLVDALERLSSRLAHAVGAPVHRGDFRQGGLWTSSLVVGRDQAKLGHACPAERVAGAIPILTTSCGSPTGIPIAIGEDAGLQRLDPWDPHHATSGLLIAGADDATTDRVLESLVAGLSGGDVRAMTISARSAPAASLAGGRSEPPVHLAEELCVEPWAGDDPNSKASFLAALHAYMLGDDQGLGPDARSVLRQAIVRVVERGQAAGTTPHADDLLRELDERAAAREEGRPTVARHLATELAGRLRTLADGQPYGALLAHAELPSPQQWNHCTTAGVASEVRLPWQWVFAEHAVRSLVRARRAGDCAGGLLVLRDADELFGAPESAGWLAATVGRARHLGLFVVAACSRLSSLGTPHGRRLARAFTMSIYTRQRGDEFARSTGACPLMAAEIDAVRGLTGDGDFYWINGSRGRAVVRCA
jgi:hypothetical protein